MDRNVALQFGAVDFGGIAFRDLAFRGVDFGGIAFRDLAFRGVDFGGVDFCPSRTSLPWALAPVALTSLALTFVELISVTLTSAVRLEQSFIRPDFQVLSGLVILASSSVQS